MEANPVSGMDGSENQGVHGVPNATAGAGAACSTKNPVKKIGDPETAAARRRRRVVLPSAATRRPAGSAATTSRWQGAADAAASDAGAVCGAGVSQEGASICGAIVSQEDTRTAAAREGNAAVCCVDAEASREGAYAAAAREGSAAVCLCVDAEIDTSAGAEVGSEVGCSGRSGRRPGSCCSSGCSSCCSSGCSRCFSRGCSEVGFKVGSVARRAKIVRSRRSRSRSSRR